MYRLFIHLATCSGQGVAVSHNRTCFVSDEFVYRPLNEPGITTWEKSGDENTYFCLVESYGLLEKSNRLSKEIGKIICENSSISFQELNERIYNSREYYGFKTALSRIDFQSEQVIVQNIGDLPILVIRNGKIEEIYEKQTKRQIKQKCGIQCASVNNFDEKELFYYLNSENDVSGLVSRQKKNIEDRDIYVICTSNVLEALSHKEISAIVSSDAFFNKANQLLQSALQHNDIIGSISVAVITLKLDGKWEDEPKLNNRADSTIKEIGKSFNESKRGKLVHDIFEKKVPETRDSLLKQALYFGLSIDEINYYLEQYGYTRLYAKNPDDYAVMYIVRKELPGKYAVRYFNSFTEIIIREMKKNYKNHKRVDTEVVALHVDREKRHDGRVDTEVMCEVIDEFWSQIQSSSVLKYAFDDRYQFLNYYLNVVINAFGQLQVRHNAKDEDFSDDKANFTRFFKVNGINSRLAINRLLNKKSQIFSSDCQIRNPVPEREFFLFIGLLCRLSEEEFDFLLDTAGMSILDGCEYDSFITVPLKKLAMYFPQFFYTYDGTFDRRKETIFCSENEWNRYLEESGLQFAVSVKEGKPMFLYLNFAEFIYAYWRQQPHKYFQNFVRTKFFEDYISQLDIVCNKTE